MPPPSDVTGLILAGGRSRRFGADKAVYPVDGRAMIAHVYEAMLPVVGFLYVSDGGHRDASLPVPAPLVVDRYPGSGPMAGIHAGLLACRTPWLLVAACDMPYLTSAVLQRVLDARRDGLCAVVGRTPDGRLQPLCACYHRRTLPTFEACLSGGEQALHHLLERLPEVAHVELPASPLLNVNERADLPAEGTSLA